MNSKAQTVLCTLAVLYVSSAFALPPAPATGDTTAPEAVLEAREAAAPLRIEVSLGASDVTGRRTPFNQLTDGQSRLFTGDANQVLDKARMKHLRVRKVARYGDKVGIEMTPSLSTEYDHQDVGVTIALVSDGKEVFQKTFDNVAVGSGDSAVETSRHSPTATFNLTRADFDGMFSEGRAPLVRVSLDVQKQK